MSTSGPITTIEEFELKYSKEIRDKFTAIRKLIASGNKTEAGTLFRALPPTESELFKQYHNDLQVYGSLQEARVAQLNKQIDGIDHRLAVMKDEKKQVLSQYNNDTAASMRQFKPTEHRPVAKATPKKRSACSIM